MNEGIEGISLHTALALIKQGIPPKDAIKVTAKHIGIVPDVVFSDYFRDVTDETPEMPQKYHMSKTNLSIPTKMKKMAESLKRKRMMADKRCR